MAGPIGTMAVTGRAMARPYLSLSSNQPCVALAETYESA
jgi:hypothetical protein